MDTKSIAVANTTIQAIADILMLAGRVDDDETRLSVETLYWLGGLLDDCVRESHNRVDAHLKATKFGGVAP